MNMFAIEKINSSTLISATDKRPNFRLARSVTGIGIPKFNMS